MVSIFIGINSVYAADPAAVTIKNNPGTMKVGDTVQLNAEVYPTNAGNKNVTWKSNNTRVVTIDSKGKIKAVGEGNAKITATTVNNKSTSITITVKNAKGTDSKTVNSGFKITSCPNFLLKGKSDTVKTSGGKNVKWSSDNNNVLTIDNKGNITAKKVGSAKITGTSSNGKKVEKTVEVISVEWVEKGKIEIHNGESKKVEVKVVSSLNFNPFNNTVRFATSSSANFKVKFNTKVEGTDKVKITRSDNAVDDLKNATQPFTYTATISGKRSKGVPKLGFGIIDDSTKQYIWREIHSYGTSDDYTIQCPQIDYSSDMKKMNIITYPNIAVLKHIILQVKKQVQMRHGLSIVVI